MSLPLIDFRCKLPEEVDIWLEAEATASGRDKADVVREVFLEWAKRRAHAYKVAARRIKATRFKGDSEGEESLG